jgi:hypothetical protein
LGAAGAVDSRGDTRGRLRKTDMRAAMNANFVFAAHRLPLALSAPRQLSARSMVYNIFRKFQRDGVWGGDLG